MEWMTMPLRRYAEFSGRSRRKEYWMFILLLVIVNVVIGIVESTLGLTGTVGGVYGPLSLLVMLAILVPYIAVGVRRLHDTGRSGWWMLIGVVPYALMAAAMLSGNLAVTGMLGIVALVGAIILLVFMVLEGTKGPNKYGPDPKEAGAGEAAVA